MTDNAIFMVQDQTLTVLSPTEYETEDVLQRLLADHPEVLAGGTTAEGQVPNLLLVRREMGVPTSAGGSPTFSVDHLFLDPAGVPVIVEVKRASDTRIRREVVGQMLDYAANGWKYWPVSEMKGHLEEEARLQETTVETLLGNLRPGVDVDAFWEDVEANLRAGHVRMLFVADHLPAELVSIIEFLNEQMRPAEVLGIEVLRYKRDGTAVYVPRLIGATSTAIEAKGGTPWTEDSFPSEAQERCGSKDVVTFRKLFDHAREKGTKLSWGKGFSPGVSGWYRIDDGDSRAVWTANTGTGGPSSRPYVYFYMSEIRDRVRSEKFAAFCDKLSTLQELKSQIAEDRKYPSVPLSDLSPEGLQSLLLAVESLIL
jgi:hypothetical protein